jgi:hypothetical protein
VYTEASDVCEAELQNKADGRTLIDIGTFFHTSKGSLFAEIPIKSK